MVSFLGTDPVLNLQLQSQTEEKNEWFIGPYSVKGETRSRRTKTYFPQPDELQRRPKFLGVNSKEEGR